MHARGFVSIWCTIVALVGAAVPVSVAGQREVVDYVDPLIGTASERTRWLFFSSACRPFGMVNLSPDMEVKGTWNAGYLYGVNTIRGFSHVHAWQLGGIPVMPTTGTLKGPQGSVQYRSHFSHKTETVCPGYHALTLDDYGIRVQLTSTDRVGFHRYTFPASQVAHVLFDLGAQCGPAGMKDACARKVSDTELEGYVINAATRRRPKPCRICFVARFDTPFTAFGGWVGSKVTKNRDEISGQDSGVYVQYSTTSEQVIKLKVALSYVSEAQARLNLEAELPHWNFERVKSASRQVWNEWLSRIEVEGGTRAQRTRFYTDLYHVLLGRRTTSDVNGKYCDMTGPEPVVRQIPLDEQGVPRYRHFNSGSLWNTFWNINIIWGLIAPDLIREWVHFLLDMYRDGGLIPRGPSGHNYTFGMIGAHSTPFIVGAYMKGIRDFDTELAYAGMRKNAFPGGLMSKAGYEHDTCIDGCVEYYIERGYIPDDRESKHGWHSDGAAMTLEYAYDDWCLAQMAQVLNRQEDYELFMKRARNYENPYDQSTGLMRPRNSDGSWIEPFEPFGPKGWCEGNAWQYTWFVPHDMEGLIRLMGGRDPFVRKLDFAFEQSAPNDFIRRHGPGSHVNYDNQPAQQLAHLFNYAGAPWLTQKWVRRVKSQAFGGITPERGYRGDDDSGQASGLSALLAIGLFQVRGGAAVEPVYEIASPVFDKVTIHLDRRYYPGKEFTIVTRNNSKRNMFIQSARLDGQPWDRPWFYHRHLVDGGTLELELGPEPNRRWGSRPEDAPPSMTPIRNGS